MALLQIDRAECIGCGACVDVCPFGALSLDAEDKAVVNELCTACRACLDVCPVDALSLLEVERAHRPEQDAHEGVWVWVEQFQGRACAISWEMLGKGR
jgi:electron transfer flavoprotein alpha subunit